MIEEVHLQRMPRILSLLAICLGSVPAQSADCAQLNNLFNIADLKTLTSGPFVPKTQGSKYGRAGEGRAERRWDALPGQAHGRQAIL